jgi:hypothetical protein
MPRSCNIRPSVALFLEKRNKAEDWFDPVFLDNDLHFLEITSQLPGRSCVVSALGCQIGNGRGSAATIPRAPLHQSKARVSIPS